MMGNIKELCQGLCCLIAAKRISGTVADIF